MTLFIRQFALACLIFGSGLPAAAQTDAGMMTCGDFAALDQAGRNEAANALQAYASNPANHSTAAAVGEMLTGMTTQEVHSEIESHCQGQPASTNVLARMSAGMP